MSPSVECLDRIWCDTHAHTVLFPWSASEAGHPFVCRTHWHVYACIYLHKSVCVCTYMCVCVWEREVGRMSNRELERGLVVLWWAWGNLGFIVKQRIMDWGRGVIGFPLQRIPASRSAYTSFFVSFFFLLKTTWIYGMVWSGGGDTDRKLGSKLNALQCIVLNNVLKA